MHIPNLSKIIRFMAVISFMIGKIVPVLQRVTERTKLYPFYKELRKDKHVPVLQRVTKEHNCTRSTKSYGKDKIVPVLQRVTERTNMYPFYKE